MKIKCSECLKELKEIMKDLDPLSENLIIEILSGGENIHFQYNKEYDSIIKKIKEIEG